MSNENYDNAIERDRAVKLGDEQTLGVLNDLLENARDGEYGFRACAQQVENAQL